MGPNMGQQLNKQVKVDLQANHKQVKLKLNMDQQVNLMQVKANHKHLQVNHQLKMKPKLLKIDQIW